MQVPVGQPSGRIFTAQTSALFVMGFLAQLGMGIVAPALPQVQVAFAVSAAQIGLFMGSFGLARLLLDLPLGMYIDRINRTVLLASGLGAICLGASVVASSTSFPLLVLGRSVMGAGSCLLYMTTFVHLVQVSDPEIRGRVIGVYQTFGLSGLFLSPAIGGLITALYSWRAAFYFCALTALLATCPLLFTRSSQRERPVITESGTGARTRVLTGSSSANGPASLMAILAINFVSFTLFVSGQGFMNTVVPIYGGSVLGLGPATIGMAIALGAGVRIATNLIGATISDRYGRLFVLVPALLILGSATPFLNLAANATAYTLVILFTGFGRAGNALPSILLADLLPASRLGAAIGRNRFFADAGMMTGPILLGWLIDASGYAAATWLVAGLLWLGAFGILALVREPPRQGSSTSPSQAKLQQSAWEKIKSLFRQPHTPNH